MHLESSLTPHPVLQPGDGVPLKEAARVCREPAIWACFDPARQCVYVGKTSSPGGDLGSHLGWHMGLHDRTGRDYVGRRRLASAICNDAVIDPPTAHRAVILERGPHLADPAVLDDHETYWINALPQLWDYATHNVLKVRPQVRRAAVRRRP
ncbi:MAG: hypothetical protein JOY61_03425 [Chloroflexi bacterium]|nr:hypothetical protein [Chloroflexota bacterium]